MPFYQIYIDSVKRTKVLYVRQYYLIVNLFKIYWDNIFLLYKIYQNAYSKIAVPYVLQNNSYTYIDSLFSFKLNGVGGFGASHCRRDCR